MSAESAPQPEVVKFEIGNKSYEMGDTVTVVRTSGDIEDDWYFSGFDIYGDVVVRKETSGDNKLLEKSIPKETFISWQEGKN